MGMVSDVNFAEMAKSEPKKADVKVATADLKDVTDDASVVTEKE